MKVKIIKCSNDNYWYKNKIGKTFNFIKNSEFHSYYLKTFHDYAIAKDDCEIIKKSKSSKKKLLLTDKLLNDIKDSVYEDTDNKLKINKDYLMKVKGYKIENNNDNSIKPKYLKKLKEARDFVVDSYTYNNISKISFTEQSVFCLKDIMNIKIELYEEVISELLCKIKDIEMEKINEIINSN